MSQIEPLRDKSSNDEQSRQFSQSEHFSDKSIKCQFIMMKICMNKLVLSMVSQANFQKSDTNFA